MTDQFSRESLAVIEKDVAEALKAVEQKHGMTVELSQLTRPEIYRAEFRLVTLKESPIRAAFMANAAKIGAKPEWLGKRYDGVTDRGCSKFTLRTLEIVGLASEHPKTPIICEEIKNNRPTGKKFLFSVQEIASNLAVTDDRCD